MTATKTNLAGLALTTSERTILIALCVPPLVNLASKLLLYVQALSAEARRQLVEEDRQRQRWERADRGGEEARRAQR